MIDHYHTGLRDNKYNTNQISVTCQILIICLSHADKEVIQTNEADKLLVSTLITRKALSMGCMYSCMKNRCLYRIHESISTRIQ